jgi:hypothetical protein
MMENRAERLNFSARNLSVLILWFRPKVGLSDLWINIVVLVALGSMISAVSSVSMDRRLMHTAQSASRRDQPDNYLPELLWIDTL